MRKRTALGSTFICATILALSFSLSSCSSDKKKDEAGGEVSGDITDASNPGATADAQIENASGDTQSADKALDAELEGTPPANDANATNNPPAPETAEVDLGGAPQEQVASNAPTPDTAPSDTTVPVEAPPAAETTTADTATTDTANNDLFGTGGEAAPKKKPAPLQHIKDMPFEKGGQLLNTVYVAREGDTVKIVSMKLFGEDHSKQLKKANPSLKNKLKVGEKVYFNSPARPDDHDRMMVVYEDEGLPPSVYTTKEGDTLKALGKEWLGNENGWKEIYAINRDLASTKKLPPGTELKYWPSSVSLMAYNPAPGPGNELGADKGTQVAQNDVTGGAPTGGNNPSTPPSPPSAANNNGNPGAPVGAAVGVVGGNPPSGGGDAGMQPPPPPAATNNDVPPPPPPPKPMKKAKLDQGMDKDIIMMVALGAAALGLAVLLGVRRAKARKQGATQI